ncbi:MAG: elongation factor G [Gammaproteobacteria bacterium]|nr:elongation factor G [Gammaproteobacteria bacterium]
MSRYNTATIRNIALVGSSGAGKTTLVESILHKAGAIGQMGSVERGNTSSDFDPLEKEYLHSLSSSLVSLDHDAIHVNIIDTPGLPEFTGQALSAFPAVETVAVVINAGAGLEHQAIRMLEWARARRLCRMIIINRIDNDQAAIETLVEEIRERFGRQCLPINLPANGGSRVSDCFFRPEGDADFSSVMKTHTEIIEQVVEEDEALMELYLEQGEDLAPEQLRDPFEKALREGHLVPICFTSATSGAGVGELLKVVEQLMPSPLEGNPRPFLKGEGEDATPFAATEAPDAHVIAHVFKITADPYVGKLGIFRIHQGTVTRDTQLFVGDGRKPIKVAHLLKLQGNQQEEIEYAIPGDICALAKVDELNFDVVLHDSHSEDFLHLKPLDFPIPVYGVAIEAQSRGDEQRLSSALQRLVEEDPCLSLEFYPQLNESVLRGLGELHLRITLEKLSHRFKVDASTRPPRIAYRETIATRADGHYRHKKQTGGAGQFGEVFLRIAPLGPGAGFQFHNEVTGGAIPGNFIPAVEKGVRLALEEGIIAGYPLQDISVTVYDGKHHSVDSKEIAFVAAARKATQLALKKAKPQILEPIVNLEITAPGNTIGAISGDLAGKRGQILGTDTRSNNQMVIHAAVPLAELNEYAGELKSMTGGAGSYTLELSHYQAVPGSIQETLAAGFTLTEDED